MTKTRISRRPRTLTATQCAVLAWLDEQGGAALVAGEYVTRAQVAHDRRFADAVYSLAL